MLRIEQAIFTSSQGGRLPGYHLTATSPAVTAVMARELIPWGPGHDALDDDATSSLNFFRLESGWYCLARTEASGREYSARGGSRLITRFWMVTALDFVRCEHDPFYLLDIIDLQSNRGVTPAGGTPLAALEIHRLPPRVVPSKLPANVTADFLGRFRENPAVAVEPIMIGIEGTEEWLRSLFASVAADVRGEMSFTTGLRWTARRPFRVFILPSEPLRRRQTLHRAGVKAWNGKASLAGTQ